MGEQVAAGFIKKKKKFLGERWGRSSVGRAPALQAGGQEFESLRLHSQSNLRTQSARSGNGTLKTEYRKDPKERHRKEKHRNVRPRTKKDTFCM